MGRRTLSDFLNRSAWREEGVYVCVKNEAYPNSNQLMLRNSRQLVGTSSQQQILILNIPNLAANVHHYNLYFSRSSVGLASFVHLARPQHTPAGPALPPPPQTNIAGSTTDVLWGNIAASGSSFAIYLLKLQRRSYCNTKQDKE